MAETSKSYRVVVFSVQSLCSLCALGASVVNDCVNNNHRGTENTELAQRRTCKK